MTEKGIEEHSSDTIEQSNFNEQLEILFREVTDPPFTERAKDSIEKMKGLGKFLGVERYDIRGLPANTLPNESELTSDERKVITTALSRLESRLSETVLNRKELLLLTDVQQKVIQSQTEKSAYLELRNEHGIPLAIHIEGLASRLNTKEFQSNHELAQARAKRFKEFFLSKFPTMKKYGFFNEIISTSGRVVEKSKVKSGTNPEEYQGVTIWIAWGVQSKVEETHNYKTVGGHKVKIIQKGSGESSYSVTFSQNPTLTLENALAGQSFPLLFDATSQCYYFVIDGERIYFAEKERDRDQQSVGKSLSQIGEQRLKAFK